MIKKKYKETAINGEAVRVIAIHVLGIKIDEERNTTTSKNVVNNVTPKKEIGIRGFNNN